MNRPYKNPNRWTINHVPVMRAKPRIDYFACVIGFVVGIGVPAWFAWALWMM